MSSTGPAWLAVSPTSSPVEHYRTAHTRGRALAELCRLQISRVPCLVMVVTALSVGLEPRPIVAGVALIMASCAIAAALNDRADVVSDRLNERADRPLATGVLGPTDLWTMVGVASALVVAAQLWLPQPNGLVVTVAAAFVAWASACEPLALQRRGLVGLVALAFGYLVLPILLVVGAGQVWSIAPLAMLGAAVLAHKDVRDEVGDRASGKCTLLVQMGYRHMSRVAAALGLAGATGLWWTIGSGWWSIPAVAAVVALASMAQRGHSSRTWLAARVALIVATVLVGAQVAATAAG